MSCNGNVIGAAVVPTSLLGSGCWDPEEISRQIAGAGSGLLWPVSPANPNFASVTLQLHFNQWTNDGRFTDKSSSANHCAFHTAGALTTPMGLTTSPIKFRQYAFSIPGNNVGGVYPNSPTASSLLMGTGDCTVEAWFYPTLATTFQVLFDFRTSDINVVAPQLRLTSGGKFQYSYNPALGSIGITGATTVSLNTWHHMHWTRSSGTSWLGLDGAQEGSDFADSQNFNTQNTCLVGHGAATPFSFQGYIQEVRVTKGVAVYARTYTVPTAPFPDY